MDSTIQDKLYETFVAVSGQPVSALDGVLDAGEEVASSLSEVVKQISELKTAPVAEPAAGGEVAESPGFPNPESGFTASPMAGSTTTTSGSTENASSSSGSGVGSTVETVVTKVLESGFGVVPLIAGMLGLFGGGDAPAPPALVKYAMPDPIYFQGAESGSGVSGADYDQTGRPRVLPLASNGAAALPGGYPGSAPAAGGATSAAPAPQITVNVQAMDSRSFLDHSSEIAQAVRDAMLNLNSINDVVSEL
jgi:hypothetical protein